MSKKKKITIEDKLKEALIPKEEQPYKIPESWEWVRVATVNNVVTGNTPSKNQVEFWDQKDIIFVKPSDMNSKIIGNNIEEYVSESARSKVRIIPQKSTLLCCIGSVGKTSFLNKEGCTNQQINALVPKQSLILPHYNYYFIKSPFFQNQLLQNTSSTTIAIINKSKTESLKYILPPLEEQERIVKKLDSMLGRINEAKELIAQAKETFENRRASILNLAFSGELTKKWRESNSIESSKILLENLNKEKIRLWEEECEKALGEGKKKPSKPKLLSMDEMLIPKEEQPYKVPKSWEWVKLGNIANKITDGSHNPPKSKKTGIPMLSAKNIKNNDLDFSNIDRLITDEEFEKENNRTNIKAGDILLTIVGTIGRTCEVKQNFPKFALQRSVAVISTYINNNYLKLAFNSKFLKDSMMKRAKGTAQLGIYLNNLKELNIPLPPLEEQKEIVRILDNVLEKEEKINEILELEEMIELLEKSILDKAFRGELGTGNLEDVPSLEVLKNILEK